MTFKTVAKIALYQSAQPQTIRTIRITRITRITRTNKMSMFAMFLIGTALIASATFLGCFVALVSMFS